MVDIIQDKSAFLRSQLSKKRKPLPLEPVEAEIDSLTHEGRGLTHFDGKVVFVDGALPGERVRFRYTRVQRRFDEGAVVEVCIYYETDGIGNSKKILLNADDEAFVNNAVQVSNISERYAPPDRHLLSAVALSGLDLADGEIFRRGIEDMSRWYPGADFRPLAVYRIPYGQFAQPPGVHGTLPENRTRTRGLFLAGEYTEDASINGSMLSGEKAAGAVLA